MRKLIVLIMLSCCVMTGCTGAKEIQNQAYITAIGLDYAKGKFTFYAQALNFSNIAKQEGSSALQQTAPILIGQSTGKSIEAALSKLEQNAALPLYYGHVNTILLSKNVIEKKLKTVIEFIGENSYLRYNCWLFGTESDIKEMFLGESFFNYPSLYTILHTPTPLAKENFLMPIEKYNRFISKYYQSVGSYIIPSLAIEKENFLKNAKPKKVASLTGGFVVAQKQYKGWVDKQDLKGLKWFSKQATHIPLSLFKEKVSVIIIEPKGSIKVITGAKPAYHLMVKANAVIVHNEEKMSVNKIKTELEQKIKNEIITTINKSEKIQADLLNISEKPYRYKHRKWKMAAINTIDKSSIKQIKVKIHIEQSVNYKR